MAAIIYNFQIEKGSDFEISFIYTDETGSAIDLSNRCVVFSMTPALPPDTSITAAFRPRFYTNEAAVSNNRYSITTNTDGTINIKLSAIETNSFNFNESFYDLDIRGLDDVSNTRISAGSIAIIQRNSPIDLDDDDPFKFKKCSSLPSPSSPTDGGGSDSGDQDSTDNPTPTPTPVPEPSEIEDFCYPYGYCPSSIFTERYPGSGLIIPDMSTTISSLNTTDPRIITNVEVLISGLKHPNPTDLVLILSPPSGDDILLSANHKIVNYNSNFNFIFSNQAAPDKYLHNITNNSFCNIYNKTAYIKYDTPLLYSFTHLSGHALQGQWDLIIKDTDPGSTGSIDSWMLMVTYDPGASLDIEILPPSQPTINDIYRFEDETILKFYAPLNNGGSDITQYRVYSDDNLIDAPSSIETEGDIIVYKYAIDYSGTDIEISAVNEVGEGPRSQPFTVPI